VVEYLPNKLWEKKKKLHREDLNILKAKLGLLVSSKNKNWLEKNRSYRDC
jgi:hypothetical protein